MFYFCKDRSLKTGQINNTTNIKIRWKIRYCFHSLCPNVKDVTKIHRLSSCCSFGRLYSSWQGVVKGIFLWFLQRKTAQIVFLMLRDLTVSCLAHGIIVSPTGASSHFLKAFPPAFLEIKLKYNLFQAFRIKLTSFIQVPGWYTHVYLFQLQAKQRHAFRTVLIH